MAALWHVDGLRVVEGPPEQLPGERGLVGDDGVAQQPQLFGAREIQPGGRPISHSTNCGFNRKRPPIARSLLPSIPVVRSWGKRWATPRSSGSSLRSPLRDDWPPANPLGVGQRRDTELSFGPWRSDGSPCPSTDLGVGHAAANPPSNFLSACTPLPPALADSVLFAVGHCENEEAFAAVGRADVSRLDELRLAAETKSFKIGPDGVEVSLPKMVAHVLEEAPRGPDVDDGADDVRPEVARIKRSSSASSDGEGLAGISANEARHLAAPVESLERLEVGPDRSLRQLTVRHARRQYGGGRCFSLHVADRASRAA